MGQGDAVKRVVWMRAVCQGQFMEGRGRPRPRLLCLRGASYRGRGPAPVFPRVHFQDCPGLIAAAHLCQSRAVVRETDGDLL
jgi:hypothetical protein